MGPLRSMLVAGMVFAQAAAGGAQTVAAVPVKAAGTLDVTYEFTSTGKRGPSDDQVLVSKVWNVKRTVTMSVRLSSDKPSGFPQLTQLTGARADQEKGRQAKVIKAGNDMAPMMASAEAILKKCGEDEACLAAEAMKMGAAMNPNDAAKAKKSVDAATAMPDATFQAWRGTGSTTTFSVTESRTVRDKDPICMTLAGATCTTTTTASGSGPLVLPSGGKDASASGLPIAEVDLATSAITFVLPLPPAPLSVSQTTKTDRPEGEGRGSGTARVMRKIMPSVEPITVPCAAGCRSYSGTKSVAMIDDLSGEAGTVVVTWTFKAP